MCFYARQRVRARLRLTCVHTSTFHSYYQYLRAKQSTFEKMLLYSRYLLHSSTYRSSILGVLYSRHCEYSQYFVLLHYYFRYYCVYFRARTSSGLSLLLLSWILPVVLQGSRGSVPRVLRVVLYIYSLLAVFCSLVAFVSLLLRVLAVY